MPLTPDHKTRIIAALRSGIYTQARSQLGNFDTKELCCIGVAINTIDPSWRPHHDSRSDTEEAVPLIGLTHNEGLEWVGWNDKYCFNFLKIAFLIEENY